VEKCAQNFFRRVSEKIGKNCSVECSHVSLLHAQQPRHLDSQRFGKRDKFKVENTANTRFNLCDASSVNRNAELAQFLGKFFLREWWLCVSPRFFDARANKILAYLSHCAARLPGSPRKVLF
jgi:hypothetical protein